MKKIVLYSIMLGTSYIIAAKSIHKSIIKNVEQDALYVYGQAHHTPNIDERTTRKENLYLAKKQDRVKTTERAYARKEKMMALHFWYQENI